MAVNQKQIAEKLGVSIALVSRVLSGKAAEIGIASDTISRVVKVAEEMGYVPSAAALTLKGKATRTIGVAVYDFNDPFFGALIKEIQIQAHDHDYSLVLAGFLNRIPDGQDLQSLHKHAIDGLIVLGSDTKATWLNDFSQLSVARIGHGSATEASVQVSIDELDAARQLFEYLKVSGRKAPAFLSRPLPAHQIRRDAMALAARAAGLPLVQLLSTEQDGFTAGKQVNVPEGTDALLCATDQIAMGVLHSLHDARIAVPLKLAVTGFDDIAAARQFMPAITTIQQPIQQIVKQAFHAVINKIEPQEILLPGRLILRETA